MPYMYKPLALPEEAEDRGGISLKV